LKKCIEDQNKIQTAVDAISFKFIKDLVEYGYEGMGEVGFAGVRRGAKHLSKLICQEVSISTSTSLVIAKI